MKPSEMFEGPESTLRKAFEGCCGKFPHLCNCGARPPHYGHSLDCPLTVAHTTPEAENEVNTKDSETPKSVEERFLKELCWQDTDGKWFLDGTPDTVPKILRFITQYHQELQKAREEEREIIKSIIRVAKDSAEVDRIASQRLRDLLDHSELDQPN